MTMSESSTAMLEVSPSRSTRDFELRPGQGAELLVGAFAEPDQPGAQRVAAVGQLADVAQRDQGAQQAVDGGKRQIGGGREFAERDVSAGIRDQFQKFEDALNGLHASGGFFSHSLVSNGSDSDNSYPHREKNCLEHPTYSTATAEAMTRKGLCFHLVDNNIHNTKTFRYDP